MSEQRTEDTPKSTKTRTAKAASGAVTTAVAETPPAPELPAPAVPAVMDRPIGIAEFVEENPRLTREARDILRRLHGFERHDRKKWQELAASYGGSR